MDLIRLHNLTEQVRVKVKATNDRNRSWYRITNSSDTTEIYIYDVIGEWGVTALNFVDELRKTNTNRIDVHINSEGGEVFDGLAIYESIRQHPAFVTTYVDGLAASAASFIAQAGDKRVMARNARMMIHSAGIVGGVMAVGNSEQLLEHAKVVVELAALLNDLSDNIADIYAEKSDKTAKQWRKIMNDEKWFSAQEAVDAGLADEVAGSPQKNNSENSVESSTFTWNPQEFLSMVGEAVK